MDKKLFFYRYKGNSERNKTEFISISAPEIDVNAGLVRPEPPFLMAQHYFIVAF